MASLVVLAVSLDAVAAEDDAATDLFYGEALFFAHQGRWFEALERLDGELLLHARVDEPERDTLYPLLGDVHFATGDLELSYRMHQRAGRAIAAVLEGSATPAVRNEAAYRLARIQFQKGQPDAALRTLERIDGRPAAPLRQDVEFLRANAWLALGEPGEAAALLKRLQGEPNLTGFSEYNLAIAHLRRNAQADALRQLERAGSVRTGDPSTQAIRDKANLLRGSLLEAAGQYGAAKAALDRVRLESPFANEALLRSGWAAAAEARFAKALVPWGVLAGRDRTDPAVQEALITLPYAYAKMDAHGRAATLYATALDAYRAELVRLDESISSIRSGRFLEALRGAEIREDRDWLIRLRQLPQAPETYYLMTLLASHDFHTGLENFLDLENLRQRLHGWALGFAAFDELINIRHGYFEPRLPEIDQEFRDLSARRKLREQQHALLEDRLQHLLTTPRPELLATPFEREVMQRLEQLSLGLAATDPEVADPLHERIARLSGRITWVLRTEYHNRLTRFHEHLAASRKALSALSSQHDAFVRTRQTAVHGYRGQSESIGRLNQQVADARQKVDRLIARQGHLLEGLAIAELERRADRLRGYEEQARFALAHSYDRAVTEQTR